MSYQIGPNHVVLIADGWQTLYSYGSPAARRSLEGGTITLHPDYWSYSKTTRKFVCKFLGDNLADVRRKIATGEYRLEQFS